jgi:hypothetical protein
LTHPPDNVEPSEKSLIDLAARKERATVRRLVLVGLLLLVPVTAWAQAPNKSPESLLAEDTLLYFRFDGVELHRQAYDQTAFGELMKGELGAFVDYVAKVIMKQVNELALRDLPRGGAVPQHLLQMQNAYGQLPQLLAYCNRHGFVAGVELLELENYRAQLTLVFPQGGERKNKDAIFAFLNLIPALIDMKVTENKIGSRTIYSVEGTEPVNVAWWQEGEHVVVVIGSEKPEHTLARADGKAKNLTANPVYQELTKFNKYETFLRGYLHFEPGLKMAKAKFPPAARLIDKLGLDGLKHLTFWSGCEGKSQRSTIVLKTDKERKGLLKAFSGTSSLSLEKLPPIPPDATSVSAMDLDLAVLTDIVLDTIEAVMKEFAPDEAGKLEEGLKQVEQMLGFDPRKDLLGSLGSQILTYSSPSEGIFVMGTTYVIQVKNAKKLQASLDKLVKLASQMSEDRVAVATRDCHGVKLQMIHIKQPGMIFVPTFAIHNDWLIVSMMPQGVQGYALRSAGKVSAWKPTPLFQKALSGESGKGKITGLSESDPRPTAKMLFSLAPLVGGAVNSFMPGAFDVSMIPNAQSVTEPLFPNVSLTIDEGDVIRSESWESLALPDVGDVGYMGILSLVAIGNIGRSASVQFGPGGQAVPFPPPPPPIERKREKQNDR